MPRASETTQSKTCWCGVRVACVYNFITHMCWALLYALRFLYTDISGSDNTATVSDLQRKNKSLVLAFKCHHIQYMSSHSMRQRSLCFSGVPVRCSNTLTHTLYLIHSKSKLEPWSHFVRFYYYYFIIRKYQKQKVKKEKTLLFRSLVQLCFFLVCA